MKLLSTIAVLSALSVFPVLNQNEVRTSHFENVLGTSLELKVIGGSAADAERSEQAALDEIGRLNKILSTWSAESEVSRWAAGPRGRAVAVSTELFEVLEAFDQWREATGGALNAAAETGTRLWHRGAVPDKAQLRAAVAKMAEPQWTLDSAERTATRVGDAPIALNSFTKSYIASRAADRAMAAGGTAIRGVALNIGGDLVARGDWQERVDIADPRADAENDSPAATIAVRDRVVATSGDYRRGVDIGGRHYSHIIDPRTALPAEAIISSTVVARDAVTAGALATAFSVLKPEESERVAKRAGDVEYLLIAANGARIASRGWGSMAFAPPPPAAPAPSPAADTAGRFDTNYELIINFELAHLDGFARRPYVAVWIEDADKFPVRTLALWYQKPRWLPDLRAWTRDDRMRSMAEGSDITSSVSSATRPAGKYTLKWDGKDNSGKLVKAGKYTVLIEAAREHGTYQLMRQEVDFTGTPKQFALTGNTEVSSASLDYRKAGGH